MDKYYSTYYYRRKSKKNKAYLSVILAVVFILSIFTGIIVIASNSKSNGNYSTSFNLTCYFLSTGNFDDLTSATVFADSSKIKGGAGYIYRKNKYNVLLSVYFEDKKAKLVQSTLQSKNDNAVIIALDFPAILHYRLESLAKERLLATIKAVENAIIGVYDISNGYDTEALTQRAVKEKLKELNTSLINEFEKNAAIDEFKKNKLLDFNNAVYKIALSLNEAMLAGDFEAKDLRFLNIDMCFMLMSI